jgi:hypothetical protein
MHNIRSFHVTNQNREFLFKKIENLDPTKQWICNITEKKTKRSNQQNKWMRGFADAFGDHFGYTRDEAYDMLMFKFCPEFVTDPETGAEIRMPGHFSTKQDGTPRNTKEAADIQEAVLRWSAGLGFLWGEE